ncbi:hypothetical protein HMPREF0307_00399 [Corynebacterium sp. DNF00584]|nr:hypothetical protein HMPREF0307_00399 [Corynebacterium sp. DNF00584]
MFFVRAHGNSLYKGDPWVKPRWGHIVYKSRLFLACSRLA